MHAGERAGMTSRFLARLDARDRAIFARWTTAAPPARLARLWTALTHLGGARASALAVVLPFLLASRLAEPLASALRDAAALAALALVVSHLLVRLLKALASRPRPSPADPHCRIIDAPECFSFPSGHAAAAAALAAGYGLSFPALAPSLALLALGVGASRVRLGVHYPGDVLAGQLIALATTLALAAIGGVW